MVRADRLRGGEDVDHFLRDYEVAEAHGGKHDGAEAAPEDDDSGTVEALERGDGASGVAVFAVVVVFEDHHADLARPLEQREAAAQAHRHAERELVRWCYVE